MKKKAYISGPITGRDIEEARRDFAHAEWHLECYDYEPVNPLDGEPVGLDWAGYMRRDIKMLVDCDAVYMLNGWRASRGAALEHQIATGLDMEIMYETH